MEGGCEAAFFSSAAVCHWLAEVRCCSSGATSSQPITLTDGQTVSVVRIPGVAPRLATLPHGQLWYVTAVAQPTTKDPPTIYTFSLSLSLIHYTHSVTYRHGSKHLPYHTHSDITSPSVVVDYQTLPNLWPRSQSEYGGPRTF